MDQKEEPVLVNSIAVMSESKIQSLPQKHRFQRGGDETSPPSGCCFQSSELTRR